MFQKPDHVRVVILTPFGTILQEVYMHGEQVTIVDPGNAIAFSGRYEDLPDKGDFSGWRFIYWLIDIDAPDSQRGTVAIERTNRFNQVETAFFDSGVLISKRRADGGFVSYNRYTAVQGAVFPFEITYNTAAKETFSVIFEDPEINVLMSEKSFLPDLKNIRILPLSSLK